MSEDIEIHKGVLERWMRAPDAKGFGIARLDRRSDNYVGAFPRNIEIGDRVALLCKAVTHPRYGAQQRVQKVVLHLPSEWNFTKWLLQRLPHIGPVRAQALQDVFGDSLWSVLEEDPQQLVRIDGITEERAKQIAHAYVHEQSTMALYTRLLRLGVDMKVIGALIRKDVPTELVQHYLDVDPFQLLGYDGISFKHCEEIASALKIPRDDPRRVRGFVVSILRDARNDGHTMLHINRIKQDGRVALGLSDAVIFRALGAAECEEQDVENALRFPIPYLFFGRYLQWRALADDDAAIFTAVTRVQRTRQAYQRPNLQLVEGRPQLLLVEGGKNKEPDHGA